MAGVLSKTLKLNRNPAGWVWIKRAIRWGKKEKATKDKNHSFTLNKIRPLNQQRKPVRRSLGPRLRTEEIRPPRRRSLSRPRPSPPCLPGALVHQLSHSRGPEASPAHRLGLRALVATGASTHLRLSWAWSWACSEGHGGPGRWGPGRARAVPTIRRPGFPSHRKAVRSGGSEGGNRETACRLPGWWAPWDGLPWAPPWPPLGPAHARCGAPGARELPSGGPGTRPQHRRRGRLFPATSSLHRGSSNAAPGAVIRECADPPPLREMRLP